MMNNKLMKHLSILLLALATAAGSLRAEEPKLSTINKLGFLEELKKMGVPADAVPEEFEKKLMAPYMYVEGEFPREHLVALIKSRTAVLKSLTDGPLPVILATFKEEGASEARIVMTYRALTMAEESIASQLAE